MDTDRIKDRIAGNLKQAEGTAKVAIGKLIDSPALVIEGEVEKAEGGLQKALGKAKDALGD